MFFMSLKRAWETSCSKLRGPAGSCCKAGHLDTLITNDHPPTILIINEVGRSAEMRRCAW